MGCDRADVGAHRSGGPAPPVCAGDDVDQAGTCGFLYLSYADVVIVVAGGVFTLLNGGTVTYQVPLTAVEIAREGATVRLRWQDRNRTRQKRLQVPEPFAAALERASASARSAEPETVPRTASEAKQAALFSWVRTRSPPAAMLVQHPVISLDGRHSDFIRTLRKRLQEPDSVSAAGAALRCALCGRPEKAVRGSGSAAIICERCAGKVRHEAVESGHGLAGREPRPL